MIITFILSPCPTCLSRFLDSFLLIDPPLLPPPISSGRRRSTSQLHPLPTYFPSPELRPPGRCPPPPLLASTARSAPRTACLRLPSYYAPFAPPRCLPRPAPRSLLAPGGSPVAGLYSPLVSLLPPRVLRRLLSYFGSWLLWVSILREDEGPGRLHPLAVARPSPCPSAICPRRRRQSTRTPPPPLPPSRLDPIPVGKVGGA